MYFKFLSFAIIVDKFWFGLLQWCYYFDFIGENGNSRRVSYIEQGLAIMLLW